MKRRYADGILLTDEEFGRQDWARGMLQLSNDKGRELLGLYTATPGHTVPPAGLLWNPRLVACVSDTISFSGIEKVGRRFVHQTWFCMVHNVND